MQICDSGHVLPVLQHPGGICLASISADLRLDPPGLGSPCRGSFTLNRFDALGLGPGTDEHRAQECDEDQGSEGKRPSAHLSVGQIAVEIAIKGAHASALALPIGAEQRDTDPEDEGRQEEKSDAKPDAGEDELEAHAVMTRCSVGPLVHWGAAE
jgi:hypothetical protein